MNKPMQDWREPVLTITGPFILGPILQGTTPRQSQLPNMCFWFSLVVALTGVAFAFL
jgi:hypothetical protein